MFLSFLKAALHAMTVFLQCVQMNIDRITTSIYKVLLQAATMIQLNDSCG